MARWNTCNVFQPGGGRRVLWHFDAVRGGFKLNREYVIPDGKPLPAHLVVKSWESLWRKKLNVAILPADKVFLRVLHLPATDEAETRQIVELQLERLSPLPVAQVVWTFHRLAESPDGTRAVIVLIVDRGVVEKYLGQIEGEGFQADRLELPALDQILETKPVGDGVWLYPGEGGTSALAVWWTGGELRSLAWLNLPEGEGREAALREQLTQMAWAGELEGWLTGTPGFHLVTDEATAADWLPLFEKWVESPVKVNPPLPPAELAALTARRSAASSVSLLPADRARHYQQQFVDRLWMRGLGGLVLVYVFGVLVYFAALQVLVFKNDSAKQQVRSLGPTYTNTLQLQARYEVLRDRADLRFAALDCWKATAELLPSGVVLQGMDLRDGKTFTVNGTAPAEEVPRITDFYEGLRGIQVNDRPLFAQDSGAPPTYRPGIGGAGVNWTLSMDLDRVETNIVKSSTGGAKK